MLRPYWPSHCGGIQVALPSAYDVAIPIAFTHCDRSCH